jgi:hypothetical protein
LASETGYSPNQQVVLVVEPLNDECD